MIRRALRLLDHYWRATTVYEDHSLFFFDIWKNVIQARIESDLGSIESMRTTLKKDRTPFDRMDFGAKQASSPSTVARIAKNSLAPKWKAQFLYKLIHHLQARTVVELGCSLGITAAYMAAANPNCSVTTLEGDPFIADYAKRIHQDLGFQNVEVISGRFEDELPDVVHQLMQLDLVFIDGHHTSEATSVNFDIIKSTLQEKSVVVLDDIYWSAEMLDCWHQLKKDRTVTSSLLYYDIGLLFFSKNFNQPLHLEWVDRWMKPWTLIKAL